MHFLQAALFLLVACLSTCTGQFMPGGWSLLKPSDSTAIESAKFAVSVIFPDVDSQFRILEAKKQVVNGLKVDLTVEVTTAMGCSVKHLVVLDVAGDKRLLTNEVYAEKCITSRSSSSRKKKNAGRR